MILGGGFSGFFTARHLKKLLKNKVSIELINRENYFVFQPLLPEVAGGSISAQNAVSPLRFLIRDIKIRKALNSCDFLVYNNTTKKKFLNQGDIILKKIKLKWA